MTSSLVVEGISYAYGQKSALDEVTFSIEPGTCCMLLGPNGAGKSTLFSLITRLYDAPHGRIAIAGHDLRRSASKALAALGVVFQQSTLDLDLTVKQNLLYHAALHGLKAETARMRMHQELTRLNLSDRLNDPVRVLNGGHRRRVEIARALMHHPALLLMDEPTVGLDVPSRTSLVTHIHSLCRDSGIAVLWATHLIDEVAPDDQLVILHRGKVLAKGPVETILSGSGQPTLAGAFDALTSGAGPS